MIYKVFKRNIIIASLIICWSLASNGAFYPIEGRLLDQNDNPVSDGLIDIQLEVLNPAGDCVVYRELHQGSRVFTGGVFYVQMGKGTSNLNNGRLDDILSTQNETYTGEDPGDESSCDYQVPVAGGGTPQIKVSYLVEGSSEFITMDDGIPIGKVAHANDSRRLAGKEVTDFVLNSSANISGSIQTKLDQLFQALATGSGFLQSDGDNYVLASPPVSTGDIEEVTAGDGLSGGGTEGAVSLDLNVNGAQFEFDSGVLALKPSIAAGDISRVIAGNGLTGGATVGVATLNLDVNPGQFNTTGGVLNLEASVGSGDIEEVIAGSGLSGGGPDGSVSLSVEVDDTSLEINGSGAIGIKAESVTNDMLKGNITGSKITSLSAAKIVGNINIADNSVGRSQLATDSVSTAELAADSVTSSELATNSVGHLELAANSVRSSELAADSVGSSELIDGSVGHLELADNSVRSSELAADSVGTSELMGLSVNEGAIQNDAVTTSKIDNSAVTTTKINNNAVTTAKINNNAVNIAKADTGTVANKIAFIDSDSELVVDGNVRIHGNLIQNKTPGVRQVLSGNSTVDMNNGNIQSFDCDSSNVNLTLTNVKNGTLGYFVLVNTHTSICNLNITSVPNGSGGFFSVRSGPSSQIDVEFDKIVYVRFLVAGGYFITFEHPALPK